MKNTFYILILILITATTLSISCNSNNVNGIIIPKYLLWNASEKDINYKNILKKALNRESESIHEFALLSFDGQYSYDHGDMMVYLIDRIGEAKFIDAVKTVDERDRITIKYSIMGGLEYGDHPKYSGMQLQDAFPKIYEFVESEGN